MNTKMLLDRIKKDSISRVLFISKGEIRTLDLTGMSRALSPSELPCHIHIIQFSNLLAQMSRASSHVLHIARMLASGATLPQILSNVAKQSSHKKK